MIKNRKRNLTVLAVLSFVCAAVALNWTYNSRWGKPDAEMVYAEDEAMAAAQVEFEKTQDLISFDLVLPYDYTEAKAEQTENQIKELMEEMNRRYQCTITVDRGHLEHT